MKTVLLTLFALAASTVDTFGFLFEEAPALAKIFKERRVAGTFVMVDARADTVFVWNQERAERRYAPGETFRIANAILALETGVVQGIDDIVPFNQKTYRGFDDDAPRFFYGPLLNQSGESNRPRNLKNKMRVRGTRTFRWLARGIGTERMRDGLAKLNYGNMRVGNAVDGFWRNGSLQISALEQAEFLGRVARAKIPVSPEILNKLRQLTLLEKTKDYELHSKSGWLLTPKPELGWWVGWVERENDIFPFALNMDMDKGRAEDRLMIGRECLKALGKL
jgi:beta-lactamase class D